MRILLDESLPHDLAELIDGHDVRTVRDEGWSSARNGKLLVLAASRFDVFITADRNLEFQQNLAKLPLAVVVLVARKNRIEDIRPLLSELGRLLNHLPPRVLRKVGASDVDEAERPHREAGVVKLRRRHQLPADRGAAWRMALSVVRVVMTSVSSLTWISVGASAAIAAAKAGSNAAVVSTRCACQP